MHARIIGVSDLERELEELDSLELAAMRATADREHGQALGCTLWQAAWCPIHGDCTCDRTFAKVITDVDKVDGPVTCPLHGELHYSHSREQVSNSGWVHIPPGSKPGDWKKRRCGDNHEWEFIFGFRKIEDYYKCKLCGEEMRRS